ncbi:hypothetical protein [Ornithinibacillus scapharcae]|uniref:hypothetical protein n=1 Tax=Ornithinibacillus scapharcae TaxID=1147159 RepID=UPI000225B26A|nr:hypothetical protein [Ornithinibacillus scapharcae]
MESIQLTAALLMEEYIKSGKYLEKKRTETSLKNYKSSLKEILKEGDIKRYVFKQSNLVAKFVPKMIYEWDFEGLLEFLSDYLVPEIYLDCLNVDNKKVESIENWDTLSIPFKQKPTFYVKPSFNKEGRALSTVEIDDDEKTEEELLDGILTLQRDMEQLNTDYEHLKDKMLSCNVLKQKKKLKHTYGSVSLVENKPKYDNFLIYDAFGEEFFMNYGKVSLQRLEELILKGYIKKR